VREHTDKLAEGQVAQHAVRHRNCCGIPVADGEGVERRTWQVVKGGGAGKSARRPSSAKAA
jgi:hypothetical protein